MHVNHSSVIFWADVESKCWLITQTIICHQQSWAQTQNTEDTSSLLLPSCLIAEATPVLWPLRSNHDLMAPLNPEVRQAGTKPPCHPEPG